jgi:hypothetical protein
MSELLIITYYLFSVGFVYQIFGSDIFALCAALIVGPTVLPFSLGRATCFALLKDKETP